MRIPYEQSSAVGAGIIELADDVVAVILQTVREGWQIAISSEDVNGAAAEVPMTERLRDGMRSVLRAPNHPWGKVLVILPGTESRSSPDTLLPDGRTDIPILSLHVFLRTQEHDPHAILECKRLSGGNSHLCREYVMEGMDRFCSGKYGRSHAVGFLIGYVIAGSPKEAADRVNCYLQHVSRIAEMLVRTRLVPRLSTWRSVHVRSQSSPIELHHALLEVA